MDGSAAFQVSAHLRKPLFVFETTKLAQVEKKFHTEQQTMAIVLDEYGGTAGLITVEDVSEEIFGSILDEYDVREPAVQTGTAGQADSTVLENGIGEQVTAVQLLQPEQTAESETASTDTAAADVIAHTAAMGMAQAGTATVQMGTLVQPISAMQPVYSETVNTAEDAAINTSAAMHAANELGESTAATLKASLMVNENGAAPADAVSKSASASVSPSASVITRAGDAVTDSNETEEPTSFFIAGITRLTDLNEKLSLSLESQYSDTIGGYIMEKAGNIPAFGYSINVEPYIFSVAKVEANRIVQVEVRMQAEV